MIIIFDDPDTHCDLLIKKIENKIKIDCKNKMRLFAYYPNFCRFEILGLKFCDIKKMKRSQQREIGG